LKLIAEAWALEAAPECGGAILSLTRAGRDVLRPTPAVIADPFDVACFPLVPYANRIAHGAFAWDGETIRLPRNHPDQPHPLHGIGWLRSWSVIASSATSIAMRMTHSGDETWPWAFTAEQQLDLSSTGLMATLDVVNDDDRAMPVSLGFHPYFAVAETLTFDAAEVWLTDNQMLPTRRAAADALGDWASGSALARPDLVDHCFVGWRGRASVARDDATIVLAADGAPALHVYVPPGQDFFCAEPVTAMPDAVNRGEAAALAPGERFRVVMTIQEG
jgi:aldose 1-epimerase